MKYLVYLFFLTLTIGCKVKKINDYSGVNYTIADTLFASNDLDSMIAPYKLEMEAKMDKVIGFSNEDMVRYSPESPLGNFVADVVFGSGFNYGLNSEELAVSKSNTICLLNFGGLRAPINKGDITIGNVYELMPFDNEIVIVSLSPSQVEKMLVYLFEKQGQPVSNAVALLSSDKQRLDIGGKRFSFEKHIYVITSDYLAKGGDKMSFFKESKMIQTGVLIRNALLNYVKNKKELPVFEVEGRIQFVKK
ncbi:MAG: 5'-nucleotidase C-terminal domain-containing protein [Mycoplasmataceae bacterium]|nr:5'-nucleotidase C-terminal domain-containing protein [Mycoplasmataceae bacterium]